MTAIAPHELVLTNKSFHSPRLEENSISSASENAPPVLSRRDTEQILDYYQSADAGHTYVDQESLYSGGGHTTQSEQDFPSKGVRSTLRPRSAGREADGGVGRASMESVASSTSGGVQRRTSQRSTGGGDKRRLAIVETDSQYESQQQSSRSQRSYTSESSFQLPSDHSLLARRGMDSSRFGGLALVAPPDANLSNYTGMSPVPSSAPATAVSPMGRGTKANTPPTSIGHQRSKSDAQSQKRTAGSKASPRDVGIVGTLETMQASSPPPMPSESPLSQRSERGRPINSDRDYIDSRDSELTAPVFQTPKSRSPSPLPPIGEPPSPQTATDERSPSVMGRNVGSGQQLTPSIGQEKEIGRPVAGPVVVDLTSGLPVFRRSPNVVPSGLPITDPPTTQSHHGDRDSQRSAGRLPFKPNQAGPTYLHYQPGVHSTAGPLPSPPRHILTQVNTSPPPRPPRLLSPPPGARRKDSEQSKRSNKPSRPDELKTISIVSLKPPLPMSREDSDFSIAAVSVSSSGSDRSPQTSPKTPEENQPIRRPSGPRDAHEKPHVGPFRNGSHVREGAFPASSVFLSQPSQPQPRNQLHTLDDIVATMSETTEKEETAAKEEHLMKEEPLSSSDGPPSTVVELPRTSKHSRSRPDLKREESWVSVSVYSTADGPDETSPPSSYSSSREDSTHIFATNLVPDDGRIMNPKRSSLPAPPPDSQRRFHSLPRTPSLSFMQSKSRTSSPSPQLALPKKTPSSWPDAMNFQRILSKKSAAERASAYAGKIHELASEDTGLGDWLAFISRKERRGTQSTSMPPSSLPRGFIKHPRQVSRSSMASEVTFPIRADSYTATDLSLRSTTDTSSPNLPPSLLPYPSLAHGVGIRNHQTHNFMHSDSSSRGLASPSSSSRTLGGAFFASIGRKTSMRRDRTLGPASPTKLISSRQTAPVPQPRPVKIAGPPTIPGGPRAHARRANSVIPAPAQVEDSRSQAQVHSMPPRTSAESTGVFNTQVEKLSDLLPHADKEVLAIYLHRAKNQDPMLAIGAYLEDEKQGTLLKE